MQLNEIAIKKTHQTYKHMTKGNNINIWKKVQNTFKVNDIDTRARSTT